MLDQKTINHNPQVSAAAIISHSHVTIDELAKWPRMGGGSAPTANGARQHVRKDSVLRELADRTGESEWSREVQYGHVVDNCGRAVAFVHQHVTRLRAAIGKSVVRTALLFRVSPGGP